jgi:hypothetical protein
VNLTTYGSEINATQKLNDCYIVPRHSGALHNRNLVANKLEYIVKVHQAGIVIVLDIGKHLSRECMATILAWPGNKVRANSVGWTSARGCVCVSQRPKHKSRPPIHAK